MEQTTPPVGRRERKKAATRQALADAALELFLARGFDAVGVREIAETADVSVTTLFKHFPEGKVALLFDEDADREAALVAAVRDRPAGQPIPQALRDHLTSARSAERRADPRLRGFQSLVDGTPELREHSRRMWLRHETALSAAIAESSGLPADDPACLALAHFALAAAGLAATRTGSTTGNAGNAGFDPAAEIDADPQPGGHPDVAALTRIFALLEHGWAAVAASPPDPA
ncbi:TetR/AcrR family transcriptional regulator [Frankia sp. AiPs1]|uniref:TetR/AcrR family transcriptional regulator n=1 Tax=Frankia sp. AiPs1 TaxID=573493 RepID=UPI002042DBCC|nr:TetR/AcrR family transcriptional regulator [Frankia sp. AiPs1]MCM3922530.1 TetR/AcrR family transcriptional regulator [Frankia sp. AiPs1]